MFCHLTWPSPIVAITMTSTDDALGPGNQAMIGRRGVEHGSGVGTQRWVVERGFAHLQRIRYERYPEIHTVSLVLACAILCWR